MTREQLQLGRVVEVVALLDHAGESSKKGKLGVVVGLDGATRPTAARGPRRSAARPLVVVRFPNGRTFEFWPEELAA